MNEEFREKKSIRDSYANKAGKKDNYYNCEQGKRVIKHGKGRDTGSANGRRYTGKAGKAINDRTSGIRKYFSKDIDIRIIASFEIEIINAFNEMPQLRKYIRSIGSRLEMGRHMRAEAYNWLIRYHMKSGIDYEDAKKSADNHIAEFSKINMSENAIAMFTTFKSEFEDANKKIFNKYKGIYLNDEWKNIEMLNDTVRKMCRSGMFSRGSGDIRQIITHEIGHAICEMLNLEKHPHIKTLYFRNRNRISGYATIDVAEFIAEAWAEYRTGVKPRKICCKVGKLIQAEYKKYRRKRKIYSIL